jgi:hypothetical protein
MGKLQGKVLQSTQYRRIIDIRQHKAGIHKITRKCTTITIIKDTWEFTRLDTETHEKSYK